MREKRTLHLEAWSVEFLTNFDLGGEAQIQVRGATKDGKGQIYWIKMKVCEHSLVGFAYHLRQHFIRLRNDRAQRNQENLAIFKESS